MERRILRAIMFHWIRASNVAWLDGRPGLVIRHGPCCIVPRTRKLAGLVIACHEIGLFA